jgi:hypothetical protein
MRSGANHRNRAALCSVSSVSRVHQHDLVDDAGQGSGSSRKPVLRTIISRQPAHSAPRDNAFAESGKINR